MPNSTATPNSAIKAEPIPGAPFGLLVEADLSTPLGPEERETLQNLYRQDGLILFRNQALGMEQQQDICAIFGPVLRGTEDNYLVSNVHEEGFLDTRELRFHHDVPYVPAPYLGGSLHALEVEPGVSTTRFSSGYLTYEHLPEPLRRRVEGRNALHVRERAGGRRNKLTDLLPSDNCAVHALVGRQKITGRPYVFADISMTAQIIGMSEAESDALLEELFFHLYDESRIYEHEWQNGDLIIWDNLALQHARREITAGRRTLQRVTIARFSYGEQYPVDLAVFDEIRTMREVQEA